MRYRKRWGGNKAKIERAGGWKCVKVESDMRVSVSVLPVTAENIKRDGHCLIACLLPVCVPSMQK